MKEITVKKVAGGVESAEQVGKLMNDLSVNFNSIDVVNWSDFPYSPDVKFRALHTGDAILLNFVVSEASVRAVASAVLG